MVVRLQSLRLFSLFAACGGLMLLAGYAVLASMSVSLPPWFQDETPDVAEPVALVAPPPFRFRQDVAPEQAVEINAALPPSSEPVLPAKPFAILSTQGSRLDQLSAVDCLTAAVYYEAASEPTAGQRAVAQVVLNRVRHPAYPSSVCEVVFQGSARRTGCQFTFTCDGALARRPTIGGWSRARAVATAALSGSVETSVGLATHYHTQWVVPYWSGGLTKLGSVGAHIFYRWNGRNGTPGAFSNRYSGAESIPDYATRQLGGLLLASASPTLPVEDIGGTVEVADREAAEARDTWTIAMPRGELSSATPASVAVSAGQLRQPGYRMKGEDQPKMLLADQGKLIDQP